MCVTKAVFALQTILFAALLYVPGLVVLSRIRLSRAQSIATAPAYTVVAMSCVTTAFYCLGISTQWWQVYALILLLTLVIWAFERRGGTRSVEPARTVPDRRQVTTVLLYLAVGFVIATLTYAKNLVAVDSFEPLFDNANHLSLIESFAKSGFYSPLFSNLYLDNGALSTGAAYYPGGYHALSALIACGLGVSAAQASNICLYAFIGIVFPLSCCAYMESMYPDDRKTRMFGALVTLAFGAFPWGMLIWGPLYPNLVSLSLVPAFLGVFICLLRGVAKDGRPSPNLVLATLVNAVAVAIVHPNGLFTAGVLLIGPIVYISSTWGVRKANRKLSFPGVFLALAAIAIIWVACYKLPFLRSTVNYTWPATDTLAQALINVLTLAFSGLDAQIVLGLLCVFGIVAARREDAFTRSMLVSLAFAVAVYVVDTTCDGTLKHLLSGFWYTDSHRTACTVMLALLPFAALGIKCVVCGLASRLHASFGYGQKVVQWAISLLALVVIFYPSFSIAGGLSVTTQFGQIRDTIRYFNNTPYGQGVDEEELGCGEELAQAIDDPSATVMNNAFDGSPFLYGTSGLNLYYRYLPVNFTPDDADDPGVKLAATLADYTSDPEAMALVRHYNVGYVLQLDSDYDKTGDGSMYPIYNAKDWRGVQSINESTPGFELVYSSGDIRLYRLTAL
ncbi:DUF6541 family protein [Paratractidigestivibacter faecalis]|uniref:DUF6541 family protein n=1 Tax=Paratractidigestivibacter faecalis TaxID=2292441 RepID=UPI003D01AF81